ncbi:helix-turn-helix transcriptional regulator [Geodermatophilaceae bacterium NBWT11]|nr:helix-turn-helix transcriptional regulator [Geodermatophilaceae bacterium NBWT11]
MDSRLAETPAGGPADDLARLFEELDEVLGRILDPVLRSELTRCRRRFHEAGDGPAVVELSPRARTVVAGVSAGSTNAEIAGELGITVDAVKGQLRVAMRAFGVHTRQAVVNAARSAGLVV